MVFSLGTLEFPQAQLGHFMLILWRLITVHLPWVLHLLLCWWHRLFHSSQTPPNQQIMPHQGDWTGKRLFCGMTADTEGADGDRNCFLFQGKTSQATSVSWTNWRQLGNPISWGICFWASLQYSCLSFLRYMYFKPIHTWSSLWIITLEASIVLPKNALPFATAEATKSFFKNFNG